MCRLWPATLVTSGSSFSAAENTSASLNRKLSCSMPDSSVFSEDAPNRLCWQGAALPSAALSGFPDEKYARPEMPVERSFPHIPSGKWSPFPGCLSLNHSYFSCTHYTIFLLKNTAKYMHREGNAGTASHQESIITGCSSCRFFRPE